MSRSNRALGQFPRRFRTVSRSESQTILPRNCSCYKSGVASEVALTMLRVLSFLIVWLAIADATAIAQAPAKKVRMGIQSTNIGFLPFHAAFHKGFYREQGIDLEMIFMATQAVNAAFVRGDLDYSAAVNGIIQGIVRGAPAKILACAVDRPLQSFIARKDIRAPRDLKGKKVAGSTTGGTATLMADAALKHFGLDPGRDVTVVTLRDNRLTALESGTVD